MSRKFEEEYKEYLNAQAPDVWSRIEAGIEVPQKDKIVSVNKGAKKHGKKKRQIRYQHYRALVSAVACLFALLVMVPAYFLLKPDNKNAEATDSAAPVVLTDATIENIEVATAETAEATEESAAPEIPQEEVVLAEAETEETAPEEEVLELEQVTEPVSLPEDGAYENRESLGTAEGSMEIAEESVDMLGEDALQEQSSDEVLPQEEMDVRILSEGVEAENGTSYTAVIEGSSSSATIELFVPAENGIVFEKDKRYTITVEKISDGNYKVVVCFA